MLFSKYVEQYYDTARNASLHPARIEDSTRKMQNYDIVPPNVCVPGWCRWFLESLLERPRPEGTIYWLRQITLECMDNMARHTACHLIAHACRHGANDPAERELLVATDRSTSRALHR